MVGVSQDMISTRDDLFNIRRNPEVRPARGLVWLRIDPETIRVTSLIGDPVELLGQAAEDWYADGFVLNRINPEDLDLVQGVLRADPRRNVPAVAEFRMRHAAGHMIWVQMCRLCQVAADGELQVSLLNIDEQVLVERALSKAIETMRDALVATSQEIALPANAISDYGGLLERHLATQRDHVGSDYALGIREAVERLKILSDSLQKVSRRARAKSSGGG